MLLVSLGLEKIIEKSIYICIHDYKKCVKEILNLWLALRVIFPWLVPRNMVSSILINSKNVNTIIWFQVSQADIYVCIYVYISNENIPYMARAILKSRFVKPGRLAHGHVGIIFTILALSYVLSTLLHFSWGNSVDVFFLLTRHTCCLIIF